VVTVLGYGEHLNIEVLFQNGSGKPSPSRNWWIISPRKAIPVIRKGVREVDICLSLGLFEGWVRVIDTPGVARYIATTPKWPIIIFPGGRRHFVVTVDRLSPRRSKSFLKDIREYVHKLFLVLNKIDYVEAATARRFWNLPPRCYRKPRDPAGNIFPFRPRWPWTPNPMGIPKTWSKPAS